MYTGMSGGSGVLVNSEREYRKIHHFMLNFIGEICGRSLWPGNTYFTRIAIRMERKLKGLKRDNDTAIRRE